MNHIIIILAILIVGVSAYIGAERAISKKRFIVKVDKDKEEVMLEPINKSKKAEFMEEATQKQLDEMDKEPAWRRFLNRFAKVK